MSHAQAGCVINIPSAIKNPIKALVKRGDTSTTWEMLRDLKYEYFYIYFLMYLYGKGNVDTCFNKLSNVSHCQQVDRTDKCSGFNHF